MEQQEPIFEQYLNDGQASADVVSVRVLYRQGVVLSLLN